MILKVFSKLTDSVILAVVYWPRRLPACACEQLKLDPKGGEQCVKLRFALEPQSSPYATGLLHELGQAATSSGPSALHLWGGD